MLAHEIDVLWAPTHPPSLNFCSSSSKAKAKAMQEMRDNTSVDTWLFLLNKLLWSYHVVPTHLRELCGIFHLALGGWHFICVSPTWPLFEINQREYDSNDTIVPQHWALRNSFWYVVPHLGSTIVSSHPTLYRLNMWSSWIRRKGTTQVMYIAKVKDGPKWVKKTFSLILERVFEMVWWRGRKWDHIKKDFWSWSVFLLSKYWLPPFFGETLGAFFSCSVSWGHGGFDDICGENHIFKHIFSNGFNILAVNTHSGVELCMPTWLNHDYGDGVVDILAVDAYSGVDVCTPIFMGEARN
jgi:hypothetical protein